MHENLDELMYVLGVEDHERNAAHEVHAVRLGPDDVGRFGRIVGINPLDQRGQQAAEGIG